VPADGGDAPGKLSQTDMVEESPSTSLYGWSYWLGACAAVLAVFFVGVAVGFMLRTPAEWYQDGEDFLAIFVWPTLIIYHLVWRGVARRASDSTRD
jgi:membrane protein DedA with SNARE-associated domain